MHSGSRESADFFYHDDVESHVGDGGDEEAAMTELERRPNCRALRFRDAAADGVSCQPDTNLKAETSRRNVDLWIEGTICERQIDRRRRRRRLLLCSSSFCSSSFFCFGPPAIGNCCCRLPCCRLLLGAIPEEHREITVLGLGTSLE